MRSGAPAPDSPRRPRPRGRPRLAFVLLTVLRVRFALMESSFLLVSQSGGGAVMGGAAHTGFRMTTFSRAAHLALKSLSESAQKEDWC